MTPAGGQSYRLMIILLVVLGLFTGCGSVFQGLDDRMHRKRFKSDYESFENALSVYKNGDYEAAMGLFKTLSTARTDAELARKAWLGEICCRLMIADTQDDYTAAIGLWHDFGSSAADNDDACDITLLGPLISRRPPKSTTQVIYINPPATKVPDKTSMSTVGQRDDRQRDDRQRDDRQRDDRQLRTEMADLKKKAEQAAQLQHRVDEVLAENRLLKEKIKALEAIDQNIQKKKTEISAPSE
ncbi:hypothetical protein [uncultured Desulfosarcina sp.]|uniref:hypothetical protein n=1 Tax=uncultured Desulfosarcina sp. TaxID=218289 RepID=UPI0029C6A91B|nr:hypothetical protein [uncultured Desulfosarcina sp.]